GRYLSLEELLPLSTHWQYQFTPLDDLVLHENSPDEIRLLIEEYFNASRTHGRSELQQAVHDRRVAEAYRVLEGDPVWQRKSDDLWNKYRLAARLEGCQGAIADFFLRAN